MLSTCLIVGALLLTQQEELVLGKSRTEWIGILKTHKEPKFRRAAVIALQVYGPKTGGVLPALIDGLENDTEPEVRREIAQAFGSMGADAKGTVDVLAEAMQKDKSAEVREASIAALGKLADWAAIHVMALGRTLKDASPGPRSAACEALQQFGEKAKLVLPQILETAGNVKEDRVTRQHALRVAIKQGRDSDKTLPVLLAIVAEEDAGTPLRKLALEGLSDWNDQSSLVTPALAKALADRKLDPVLRLASASSLTKLGAAASAAWPTVKQVLAESDNNLRYQAIRLTGVLASDNKEASALLLELLPKEQNAETLIAIIQEVGELSLTAAEPTLSKLVDNDTRKSVRDAAADAIKAIQGK